MLPRKTFESSDTVPAKSSAGKVGLSPPQRASNCSPMNWSAVSANCGSTCRRS